MAEEEIGVVVDFFAHPVVAGIQLTTRLKSGERIRIKGHHTDMELIVTSMQIDRREVLEARPGEAVGIKVPDRVQNGDRVYRITG